MPSQFIFSESFETHLSQTKQSDGTVRAVHEKLSADANERLKPPVGAKSQPEILPALSIQGAHTVERAKSQEKSQENRQSSVESLQRAYDVHVMQIMQGTTSEQAVYQHGLLQFVTPNADLEKELKQRQFLQTDEVVAGQKVAVDDYLNYLKRNYGAHLMEITVGSQVQSYSAFVDGKTISGKSLQDLHSQIEAADLKKIATSALARTTMTRLPNETTMVEFSDRSQVSLNGNKEIQEYTTADGKRYRRDEQLADTWISGGETWHGRFHFSEKDGISFAFDQDAKGRLNRQFNANGGYADALRDGSRISVKGDATTVSSAEEAAEIRTQANERFIFLTEKNGAARTYKLDKDNALQAADGRTLTADEQLKVRDRLAKTYEKLSDTNNQEAQIKQSVALLEQQYRPGDTSLVPYYERLAEVSKAKNEATNEKRHLKTAAEIKRVASNLDAQSKAGGPLERTALVADALPRAVVLEASDSALKLSASDFEAMLKAIPGVRVPSNMDLSRIRSVSVEDGKLKIDGQASLQIDLPGSSMPVQLKLDNVTCDLKRDKDNPGKLCLSNIKGITAEALLAKFAIEHLEIAEGPLADSLVLTGADLKPVNYLAQTMPKEKLKIPETEIAVPKETNAHQVFSQILNFAGHDKTKDPQKLASSIAALYADKTLVDLFKDVASIKKSGNQIEVTSANGDHTIGGLPFVWESKVSAELKSDGGNLSLDSIKGIKSRVPLPGDVAQALGMKNPIEVSLEQVSISAPHADGTRDVRLKTNSTIDSISMRVGADFSPVCDAKGNIALHIDLLKDGSRMPLELMLNPKQLAEGDLKKIDFTLNVPENKVEAVKLVEGFFGNQLDDTVRMMLEGVSSISKKGDYLTIERKRSTALEMNGLKFEADKKITFRINPDEKNVELKDIAGLKIVGLPDIAGEIYRDQLPIVMKQLTLSGANEKGERVMTLEANGVVSSARIKLNANMTPTEIVATVANPLDAGVKRLERDLGGRVSPTTGKKYNIRITNNTVDLNGLGGVSALADMTLDAAGQPLSPKGAVLTTVGVTATYLVDGPEKAGTVVISKANEAGRWLMGR